MAATAAATSNTAVSNTTRATRTSIQRMRDKESLEKLITSNYGLPPINPFRSIRLSNDLGLQELADKIGVSKQALIRLEQGTYDKPLPKVFAYFVESFVTSELQLMDAYEGYQTKQRLRHFRYFGELDNFDSRFHPLRQLRHRIDVTPTEVAKALCLPQATLTYFERKPVQQKSVPRGLINVLNEIGYRNYEVAEFKKAYAAFRERLINERS